MSDLRARLLPLALDHGADLFDLALRAALPADAPSPSAAVRAARAACAASRAEALEARQRGEPGEAEAHEEIALSHARAAAHEQDLGRLGAEQEQAAQTRAQLLGLTLAVAKGVAPLLLAAVG